MFSLHKVDIIMIFVQNVSGCLNAGEDYVVFIHLMFTTRVLFSLSLFWNCLFLSYSTLLSVLLSAFSVTNLFLFTSSPVFCSVSLFICSPFNLFFFGFGRVKVPAGGEKTNFDCFFFFNNYGAQKKGNMKNEF